MLYYIALFDEYAEEFEVGGYRRVQWLGQGATHTFGPATEDWASPTFCQLFTAPNGGERASKICFLQVSNKIERGDTLVITSAPLEKI